MNTKNDASTAPAAPGLRERKAAATRMALTRALSERLIEKAPEQVTADELAEAAGVSRVTFFNYFASKEAAVENVLVVWLYEWQCENAKRARRGLAAIQALFRAMGAFVQKGPLRARTIIAWFVATPSDRPRPTLSRAERELIAGDGATTPELETLGELLQRHLSEAREDGELCVEGSDYELAHMLGVLLIGGCLVGHSKPRQNWERLYQHHLRRALALDEAPAAKKRKRATRAK